MSCRLVSIALLDQLPMLTKGWYLMEKYMNLNVQYLIPWLHLCIITKHAETSVYNVLLQTWSLCTFTHRNLIKTLAARIIRRMPICWVALRVHHGFICLTVSSAIFSNFSLRHSIFVYQKCNKLVRSIVQQTWAIPHTDTQGLTRCRAFWVIS